MSRQINLYDPALLHHRQWLTADNLAVATGLLFLLLLAWGAWLRIQVGGLTAEAVAVAEQTKLAQEQSIALGTELSSRKPDPKLAEELVVLDELLGVRQGILSKLGQGLNSESGGYAEYLHGLARQTVAGLWLTGFTVGADGSGMEIRGRTLDPALLPEYIRRLNGERAFHGHRFAALSVSIPEPAKPTPGKAGAIVETLPLPLRPAAPPFHEFALVPEQDSGPVVRRAP
jgi:hypothetical protein